MFLNHFCFTFEYLKAKISDGDHYVMACFSDPMTRLFNMQWVKEKSIIKIKRFFTSTRDGLLVVHIYKIYVIKTVCRQVIGSPKNIGVYMEKCTMCHIYWKSIQAFKRCDDCRNVICNKCVWSRTRVALCEMCNKINCIQCARSNYNKCLRCYNVRQKYTWYCIHCWEIISERIDYTCDVCYGHPMNGSCSSK